MNRCLFKNGFAINLEVFNEVGAGYSESIFAILMCETNHNENRKRNRLHEYDYSKATRSRSPFIEN